MAAPETLIVIEESLSVAMRAAWAKQSREPALRILAAMQQEDWTEARRWARELHLFDVANDFSGRIESTALSAYILGQNFIAGSAAETSLMLNHEPIPDQIMVSSSAMVAGIQESGARVQARVEKVIAAEQTRAEERVIEEEELTTEAQVVQKAVDQALSVALQKAVATGGTVIDTAANLTTTRLAAYGSLTELKQRGVSRYQINEILDERTCPVCRRMHGRVFSVDQPLERLDQQLLNGNPANIAAGIPFPKQSRAGIINLTRNTLSQLQDKGHDTPPFHPMCRGIVVRAGTVPSSETVPFRPDPGVEAALLEEGTAVEGLEAAAQELGGALAEVTEAAELEELTIPARFRDVSSRIQGKIKGGKARQVLDDLDELFAAAEEADPLLQSRLTQLVDELGGSAETEFPPGLKSRARVVEKANTKYGGDLSSITDFSRATLKFDDLDEVYNALSQLESKGLKIVRINDRFLKPTAEGYSDIILGIEMPNGHVVELQLHIKEIARIKDTLHPLYERQRSILARVQEAKRGMTLAEEAEVNSLIAQQQAGYRAAVRKALNLADDVEISVTAPGGAFPSEVPSALAEPVGTAAGTVTPVDTPEVF